MMCETLKRKYTRKERKQLNALIEKAMQSRANKSEADCRTREELKAFRMNSIEVVTHNFNKKIGII